VILMSKGNTIIDPPYVDSDGAIYNPDDVEEAEREINGDDQEEEEEE